MTPEDLVEIHAIEQLKYRYVRFLDLKEWDEIERLFVPDATASYGGGAYTYADRAGIMAFLRESMASTAMLTSHKVHHPEIELTGPDTATGIWALEDVVVHGDYGITIQGAAFYNDRYVKVDGDWRIAHTGYKRVYEELFPRASIEGLQLTAQWWATEGRSTLG